MKNRIHHLIRAGVSLSLLAGQSTYAESLTAAQIEQIEEIRHAWNRHFGS